MLQNNSKNRDENVIPEIVDALKNKGFEFPRTYRYSSEVNDDNSFFLDKC